MPISLNEYRSGSFLAGTPDQAVLVGTDASLPPSLRASPTWARAVRRIETLDVGSLINSLNEVLRFSPGEWRALAHQFDLNLQDDNAERRRFGKYGNPEAARQAPPDLLPPQPALTEGVTVPLAPVAPAPAQVPPSQELPAAVQKPVPPTAAEAPKPAQAEATPLTPPPPVPAVETKPAASAAAPAEQERPVTPAPAPAAAKSNAQAVIQAPSTTIEARPQAGTVIAPAAEEQNAPADVPAPAMPGKPPAAEVPVPADK